MITFKQFLQEASHRTDISVEKAWELLEVNCKDALKNFKLPLWRGTRKAREDAYLFHPGDEAAPGRTSANTTNYYTVIMDKFLPYYGYPKRSKSIILGNFENLAYIQEMGNVYAIFPYDGVEIGVCEDYDLWETAEFAIGNYPVKSSIRAWNNFFREHKLSEDSWEDFRDSLEEAMADGKPYAQQFLKWFGPPEKIEEIFKKAYSPETLNTELSDSASIRHVPGARELWISGNCIGLSLDTWKQLKKEKGFK